MTEQRDQDDVLAKKDGVTKSPTRGLQIWDDDAFGVAGQGGDASQGTAERAGRLKRRQDEAREG